MRCPYFESKSTRFVKMKSAFDSRISCIVLRIPSEFDSVRISLPIPTRSKMSAILPRPITSRPALCARSSTVSPVGRTEKSFRFAVR